MQGTNNRISKKSTQGGTHVDEKGLFIDPVICGKGPNASVILSIMHLNWGIDSGFAPLKEIVFLVDGKDRVALPIKAGDWDFHIGGYNALTHNVSTSMYESGSASISAADYQKIAEAQILEVKVVGGKRTMIYSGNMEPTFKQNLLRFYNEQVKLRQAM
jgi:hypothetical protein